MLDAPSDAISAKYLFRRVVGCTLSSSLCRMRMPFGTFRVDWTHEQDRSYCRIGMACLQYGIQIITNKLHLHGIQ